MTNLATGSLPNPPDLAPIHSLVDKTCPSSDLARRPVYASLSSLHKISKIYQKTLPCCPRDPFLSVSNLVSRLAGADHEERIQPNIPIPSSPPDGVGPGLVDHSEAMNHQQPLGMRMASSQNTMSNIKEKDRAQRRRSFRDTNLAQEMDMARSSNADWFRLAVCRSDIHVFGYLLRKIGDENATGV
jgi:hypothetical protein